MSRRAQRNSSTALHRMRQAVDDADAALRLWGCWYDAHVSRSRLGYPSSSPEQRIRNGPGAVARIARAACLTWPAHSVESTTRFRPIAPDVMLPAEIQIIDRIVRDLDPLYRRVAEAKYLGLHLDEGPRESSVTEADRARGLGISYGQWRRVVDNLLHLVAGRLWVS